MGVGKHGKVHATKELNATRGDEEISFDGLGRGETNLTQIFGIGKEVKKLESLIDLIVIPFEELNDIWRTQNVQFVIIFT